MRAWVFSSPGTIESRLQLDNDAPKAASPGEDQVLVAVMACGLNPADYKVPELGLVARAIVGFPKTPGMDLCGRVVSVGSSVRDIKPEDLVLGRANPFSKFGALSEEVVLERKHVAVVDEQNYDLAQAAGLPTAALTAYQSIKPYVEPGDKIFVNGGSGGVGTLCIQVAKILGCHVTVSCSTGKVSLCRELGADDIIDYKTTDVVKELARKGRTFSLIVDNVGNNPSNLFSASNDYLKEGRPYVFVGGKVSFATVKNLFLARTLPKFMGGASGQFVTFMTKDTHEDLETVAGYLAQGKLCVIVDKVFEFDQAKAAMQYVKEGSSSGKVIVKVGQTTT